MGFFSLIFIYSYIFIFVLGTCIGSFINVVIDRVPKNKKLVNSRSNCPFCKKTLSFRDLLPLISFISLKGKCRYCKKSIDPTLPLVELLTGMIFVSVFAFNGNIFNLNFLGWVEKLYYLVILCLLVAIFFMDLKYRIIEDKLVMVGIFTWVSYTLISKFLILYSTYLDLRSDLFGVYLIKAGFLNNLVSREAKSVLLTLISAVLLLLFFYFLVVITKGRGMGGGDVKFSFLMGLILGFPKIIPAFFISFLTGALVGLILILIGKKTIKQTIPFGPFLVMGTVSGFVLGDGIIAWYLKLLQ